MIDQASAGGMDDAQYLPARMLNEFSYCPRLFYLEHVEGLFAENRYTLEGAAKHRRVDKKPDPLKSGGEAGEEKIHARSVTLHSDRYGVIAKLDLVEAKGDVATPVDYKRGAPKKLEDGSPGAWDPERIQLCVQALVLRENGYRCEEGVLFFWKTRQRVRVPIDEELLRLTEETIREAREAMHAEQMPPPLVDSPKCPKCSLVGICLPDETLHCGQQSTLEWPDSPQRLLFEVGPRPPGRVQGKSQPERGGVRQLVSKRDERRPLYLNSQGVSVGKNAEVLKVRDKGKVLDEFRLKDVSQVNLMGSVQVSTQAVQALMQAEIPLLYFSMGGWFYGMTQSVGLKNIMVRREQFRGADDPVLSLELARQLVKGKIRNQRTLLMRNHVEPPREVVRFLKTLADEVDGADSLGTLLGVEGVAARHYFEHFAGMLKAASSHEQDPELAVADQGEASFRFDFRTRNRRPPRDPINALLSLGYSLLSKDLTVACAAVGLDPYLGFYHQPRFGRPALALDLMEPFRPLIVDSAVLSAVNQRMVTPASFQAAGDAVALKPEGRKAFFQAYEQRMDQLVTHPLFGYRVSYRRVVEIQVRLLGRLLQGEIGQYSVFTTR